MPWWSWLIIWGALVLALLGMLAFFAVWLFRKLMAAGREVSALAEKAEVLQRRSDELRDPAFHSAVFADLGELQAQREQGRSDRAYARQARRDARVRRGKLLTNADPTQFSHLTKRT
ncbi:hypothetical protein ACFVWR_12530 [Leifsonia sp. NPDC058292]|uniref:hypothetical protein n=1 Tax=Leifsonia sp. NPDC058292 TaxID=3346428 RepID=UPI0036D9A726